MRMGRIPKEMNPREWGGGIPNDGKNYKVCGETFRMGVIKDERDPKRW